MARGVLVKLVACPKCHAQYDVAGVEGKITCRCGATFASEARAARDSAVTRCASCGALLGAGEPTCSYCRAEISRTPPASGPVCPECYARNPENARHCTACGIPFLPQPLRHGTEALHCPVCPGTELASRNIGGLWVDECPMCLGLWAPGDVMDRLVDRIRERRRREGSALSAAAPMARRSAWQAEVTYRHCPECGGAMQRKNFGRRSGVVVDWCGSHGTWLDAREMEDIAAFVLEGGLEVHPGEGSDRGAALPADPSRTAAILAAEQLLIEERARWHDRSRTRGFDTVRVWKGIGDFFEQILK